MTLPSCPLPQLDFDVITLGHGSGGLLTHRLLKECIFKILGNEYLAAEDDGAILQLNGKIAMTTDSFVVSPIFFPGGNIGDLAVHGTVNDVAMSGAKPLYLSAGFILEEGFPLSGLEKIVISMAAAAKEAGVAVITGDTKVVEKGSGDGVFITTTGIGVVADGINISGDLARSGDAILVSGTMGDHGVAIMSSRENLQFETTIESDSAALHTLISDMVAVVPGIHCLRDPTRGGLATTLNEIAQQSMVGMKLYEAQIPVKPAVTAACELLGLDPLYVANEGKLICICAQSDAQRLLKVMQQHPLGEQAAIIGEVTEDEHGFIQMETSFGGSRIVDWLVQNK